MRYIFDESGVVNGIGLWYPGDTAWTDYYFAKNLQGDVLEVYDSSHTCVASYTYDSWGNILSKSGDLADINPFRYRSYYYDTETWFYYLQSRYYDPAIGRFINADAFVSTGQGLLGNNMFAYCLSNPINRTDSTGTASLWYYLIVDSDMGFIHRAVQKHIESTYAVSTEVRLSRYGRADILRSGAVWEIKHAGISTAGRTAEAYAQAFSYMLVNDEVTSLGEAGAFGGWFYIGCLDSSYLVEYSTPAQGVVLYTVTEVKNYSGEYAFVYAPKKVRQNATVSGASMALVGAGVVCGLAFSTMNRLSCNSQLCFAALW